MSSTASFVYRSSFGVVNGRISLRCSANMILGLSIVGALVSFTCADDVVSLGAKANVVTFGAVRDGKTDDTKAIQSAIDHLGQSGGTLFFPQGAYVVSDHDSDGHCLIVRFPIQIVGEGAFYTAIRPADNVPPSANTLLFNPSVEVSEEHTSIEKIMLGNPSTGRRAGNHGVFCLTTTNGQALPKFTMRDVYIGQGNGFGFYHLNDYTKNENGGLYSALIHNCTIKGGIKLENSGDSIAITNNRLTGSGIGIEASLTSRSTSSASLLTIADNNITNRGGAIKIDNGPRTHILRNNCEHSSIGASNHAMVDINSTNGTFVAGVISQNLFSAFGKTDVRTLIRVREARGTLIKDNTLLAGVKGTITGIEITESQDVRIGPNSFNQAIVSKVSDSGIGTMGVTRPITLQNSWVAYGPKHDQPSAMKSIDGFVTLSGVIKDGKTKPGTLLFNLPRGFCPERIGRYSCVSLSESKYELAHIEVHPTGEVLMQHGANKLFAFSGVTFRTANAADSVSPE